MEKIVKDLCVVVGKFLDKEQKEKNDYKKIGVLITDFDNNGKEYSYMLLDKTVNLAGVPNFRDEEKSKMVFVSVFEQKKGKEQVVEEDIF